MNYYEDEFTYKKYHLKDHPIENIECIFYDAIEFIEECRNEGGRVFVHCVQGISRSATIVMSYLILVRGYDYKEAFDFMQAKRQVINPNLSFITQLMWFHKRLYQPFDSIPVNPRVFIVCSHEREDPLKIVAKLMMEHFFIEKLSKSMDPRGVYIVQTENDFRIIIGSECKGNNLEVYMNYAREYINKLQVREAAPLEVEEINENEIDDSFWKLWGRDGRPEQPFCNISAWNSFFPNVSLVNLTSSSKKQKLAK